MEWRTEDVVKDARANVQVILLFLFYFILGGWGGAVIGSKGLYEWGIRLCLSS